MVKFPKWTDHGVFHCDPDAEDLIRKLLVLDPRGRLGHSNGVSEIKEHTWFSGLNWEKLGMKGVKPEFSFPLTSDSDTSHFDDYTEKPIQAGFPVDKENKVFARF